MRLAIHRLRTFPRLRAIGSVDEVAAQITSARSEGIDGPAIGGGDGRVGDRAAFGAFHPQAAVVKAETVKVSEKLPGVASWPVSVQRKSGTAG